MLLIHLFLIGASCRKIEFEGKTNYTKDELLEKLSQLKNNAQLLNEFQSLTIMSCEATIRYRYPNISTYTCAFYSYMSNKLTTTTRDFEYNETIEIEDSQSLNSLCLDCKTLNYFNRYIKPIDDLFDDMNDYF